LYPRNFGEQQFSTTQTIYRNDRQNQRQEGQIDPKFQMWESARPRPTFGKEQKEMQA
jgi:hypothetical protein